ncbi:hypothetical protein OsJ_01631 [Oryza sativa Japonica Group]|uniref:Uncharacterized protein n=1 Tax=Oryza sativa subsp. japonica TaxID=39947 RepID=B9EW96_ORYSJ|nr:hypothetical protein OsJ_01631 [Oryza sativa Japonica Group]
MLVTEAASPRQRQKESVVAGWQLARRSRRRAGVDGVSGGGDGLRAEGRQGAPATGTTAARKTATPVGGLTVTRECWRRSRDLLLQIPSTTTMAGGPLVVALITDQPSFMVASRGSSAEGSRSQTNNRWIRELHVVLWDACDPAVYVDLADGSGHYTVRRLA